MKSNRAEANGKGRGVIVKGRGTRVSMVTSTICGRGPRERLTFPFPMSIALRWLCEASKRQRRDEAKAKESRGKQRAKRSSEGDLVHFF